MGFRLIVFGPAFFKRLVGSRGVRVSGGHLCEAEAPTEPTGGKSPTIWLSSAPQAGVEWTPCKRGRSLMKLGLLIG